MQNKNEQNIMKILIKNKPKHPNKTKNAPKDTHTK